MRFFAAFLKLERRSYSFAFPATFFVRFSCARFARAMAEKNPSVFIWVKLSAESDKSIGGIHAI